MSDTPIAPAAASVSIAGANHANFLNFFIAGALGSLAYTGTSQALSNGTPSTGLVGAAAYAGNAPTVAIIYQPTFISIEAQGHAATVKWLSGINQTMAASPPLEWRQASFQVTGTFGAAGSVRLDGSNDGITWVALSPTALTAAGFFAALGANEKPKFIRPNVTAGDGTTALTIVGWFN